MRQATPDRRLRGWPLSAVAVTGVGSLPFSSLRVARAFVRRHCAEVPFLPEISRRGQSGMVDEVGVRPRPATRPAGSSRLLKAQLCGPLTLASVTASRRDFGPPSPDDVIAAFARVEAAARARIGALRREGLPILFVLDEPVLSSIDAESRRRWFPHLRRLIRKLRSASRVFVGLHCCGAIDSIDLDAIDPDAFSFDATGDRLKSVLASSSVGRWRGRGRVLLLGIAPTKPSRSRRLPSPRSTARTLRRAIGAFDGPPVLLTGSCGFLRSSPSWTARAHRWLTNVADEWSAEDGA